KARIITLVMRKLIEDGEPSLLNVLTTYQALWEAIGQALHGFETLTGVELGDVMDGKRAERQDDIITSRHDGADVPNTAKSTKKRTDAPTEAGMEPQPES